MFTRRTFNKLGTAAAVTGLIGGSVDSQASELKYTDDGLVYQPWFLDSFLILNEDLAEAHADDKRFVIFWELKGCPYCKETHRVNLVKPDVLEFVQANFSVLQLNVIGSRIVTDFDGEELSEKDLAKKWQVRFTPTIQFFEENPDTAVGKPGRESEVARMPGYFKPGHFLAMFKYVEEKAYEKQKFHEYVKAAQKS